MHVPSLPNSLLRPDLSLLSYQAALRLQQELYVQEEEEEGLVESGQQQQQQHGRPSSSPQKASIQSE